MHLTKTEEKMLNGEEGYAVRKAMQILSEHSVPYGRYRHVLVDTLFANIPSGVGSRQPDLKLSRKELKKVLETGPSTSGI